LSGVIGLSKEGCCCGPSHCPETAATATLVTDLRAIVANYKWNFGTITTKALTPLYLVPYHEVQCDNGSMCPGGDYTPEAGGCVSFPYYYFDCDNPGEQSRWSYAACEFSLYTDGTAVNVISSVPPIASAACDFPVHPGCAGLGTDGCDGVTLGENSQTDPVQYMTGIGSSGLIKSPMCQSYCKDEFLGICDIGGPDECNRVPSSTSIPFFGGVDTNDNDPYFFRVSHFINETTALVSAGSMIVTKNLTLWTKEGSATIPYTFSNTTVSVASGVYINWDTQTTSTTSFSGWDLRIRPLVTGSIIFESYRVASVERSNLRVYPIEPAFTYAMPYCASVGSITTGDWGKGSGTVVNGWTLNTKNYIGFRWEQSQGSGSYKYGWLEIIVGSDFTDIKIGKFCLTSQLFLAIGECLNCFPNIEPKCYALVLTVSVTSSHGDCDYSTQSDAMSRVAFKSYHTGSVTAANMLTAQMGLFWMLGGFDSGGYCLTGNPVISKRTKTWTAYVASTIGNEVDPGECVSGCWQPYADQDLTGCVEYIPGDTISLTAAAEVQACNGGTLDSSQYPFCFRWFAVPTTITGGT